MCMHLNILPRQKEHVEDSSTFIARVASFHLARARNFTDYETKRLARESECNSHRKKKAHVFSIMIINREFNQVEMTLFRFCTFLTSQSCIHSGFSSPKSLLNVSILILWYYYLWILVNFLLSMKQGFFSLTEFAIFFSS